MYISVCVLYVDIYFCVCVTTYLYLFSIKSQSRWVDSQIPARPIPALQGFQGPNQWLEGLFKNWPHHGPAMGSTIMVVPAMVPCLESKHKEQKQLEIHQL